jgi:DNA mismatch endonuclease, patch repair protein
VPNSPHSLIPPTEGRARIMRAIRSKNSRPEIALRRALWRSGYKGYRVHYRRLPGRPDIVYVGRRVAIFVHGCFWHRCIKCNYHLPRTNRAFWQEKFERNVARDAKNCHKLQELGWTVLQVWECEIQSDIEGSLHQIVDSIRRVPLKTARGRRLKQL